MFGGKFKHSAMPIGIDVGTHGVRLLQLAAVGDGYRAIAAAAKPLPQGLKSDAAEYRGALAQAIRAALSHGGFHGKQVVSCLPADVLRVKNLRLPTMPEGEMESAVKWEAAERFRIDADKIAVQFMTAGQVRQGDDLREEIIVMASSSHLVDSHIGALTDCGLQPLAIDSVPTALGRIFAEPKSDEDNNEKAPAHVVIDAGHTSTKVLIFRGDTVVFYKVIDIGGSQLDQRVAEHLQMPLEEITPMREQLSESDDSEVGRALLDAMRPMLTELGKEIALCLRYYGVTFRGSRPQTVRMVGGNASQKHIVDVISEHAGIQVNTANPLANIDLSDVSGVIPPHHAGAWALAMGLSGRGQHLSISQTTPSASETASEVAA